MTFLEKFEEIKNIANVDVKFSRDFAIQINLTDDDCNGAFYVENRNGVVTVAPYDYNDRDALMSISSELLINILTGKQDAVASFFAGKFKIEGDVKAVLELTKISDTLKEIKKAEEKKEKEAKKAEEKAKKEAKKTEKKSSAKKSEKSEETEVKQIKLDI